MYLFQDFLEDRFCAIRRSYTRLCAPQILIALGNAQFENVAPPLFIADCVVDRKETLQMVALWTARGLFQQSVYGISGLLLALITGYRSKRVWIYMTVSGLSWAYYTAVTGERYMNQHNQLHLVWLSQRTFWVPYCLSTSLKMEVLNSLQ